MKPTLLFLVFICGLTVASSLIADKNTYLRVTLHVYSGKADPEWKIESSSRDYTAILNDLNGVTSTQLASNNGYKGFSIEMYKDSVLSQTVTVGKGTIPSVERLLLNIVKTLIPEKATQLLSASVIELVESALPAL